jgi:hypothetical protein
MNEKGSVLEMGNEPNQYYFGEKGKGHILKIQISSNKSGEFVHCELRYVARTQLLCLWRYVFRMELRGSGSPLI